MIKNTANLLNLQNLMKRDPQSYLEEFRQQQRHFAANLHIFHNSLAAASASAPGAAGTAGAGASPASNIASGLSSTAGTSGAKSHKFSKDFGGLVTFLAHVSPCFATECAPFPQQILELLTTHVQSLDPGLRKTVVAAAILLQNRGLLDRMVLLPILFQLFKVQDKPLRLLLFHHIISDIKRINQKRAPGYVRVNAQLQNYMYTMLSDKSSALAAKKSLDVMIDLWRRKIWNDTKTVHAIQNACFSKETKIKVTSLRFFLGMSFYEEEEEEEEEEEKATIRAKLSVSKGSMKGVVKTSKRKKKEREMKRATKKMNREDSGKSGHSSVIDDCPAIMLLHDPQSFAERLFSMVRNSNEAFQVRMLIMNVISRLVGSHRLVLLNFYPFLQKYMQPHQKNVTHILTYLAQATHPLVPPEVLQPCIRTLANHFVNDRSSPEVTAVGLNAIREICARAPLVMDSELLWDLVGYKKDKNKGVMMASRSLIALFRDINPLLLMRKERGKFAAEFDETTLEYGSGGSFDRVRTDIVGAELLSAINTTVDDSEGGEPLDGEELKKRKALKDDDDWNIAPKKRGTGGGRSKQQAADSSEEEDSDDEDLGTGVKEINAFLRSVDPKAAPKKSDAPKPRAAKMNKKTAAAAKAASAAAGSDEDEEDGEEMEDGEDDDEEEGEGEDGVEQMELDGASDDDEGEGEEEEDGEDAEEEEEEEEEEDGEDDEEGEDAEEEEEDEQESAVPASKKRRTATGSITSATPSAAAAASPDTSATAEPAKPSLPIGATRILTPKDFEELRAARYAFEMAGHRRGGAGKDKRKREDGSTLLNAGESEGGDDDVVRRTRKDRVGEVVSEDAIVGWKSRKRMSKEERLASIMEGRDGGINSKKKGGGSTNMDKARAKPFQLTKHSEEVQRKKQRSFSQQQKAFSGHIKTMKGMGKKIKNKMKKRKSSKTQAGRG